MRIISLSSHGHVYAFNEGVLFDTLSTDAESLVAYGRYGQSKLAIILWTRQMARKYPKFTLASIFPGVVRTNLMNDATGSHWVIRLLGEVANRVVTLVDQGVENQLWASVARDVRSGEYYEPLGIGGDQTPMGEGDVLGLKVLEWMEKQLWEYP